MSSKTILISAVILRFRRKIFTSITKISMHQFLHHYHGNHHRFQFQHLKHLLRRILFPGLIANHAHQLMNFSSSGLCRRRILKNVIHFFGGMAAVFNFRTYIVLFVTYFQSQVCYYFMLCNIHSNLWITRVCRRCGTNFFWWERHNIPSSS